MPTISEYLQIAAGGAGVVFANVGVWVQMVNNATGVAYVSTAATDSQGKYTVQNVPAGTYTVNTGPTSIGPWTSTGDTAYAVGDQSFNFNVKDFGAKGDGATDDSTSIQNTINTANTAGGVAAMTTTLNTTTLDHFVCDGTKWRIKSRVTGQ